jgi:DNA-binding CsgD family transcriptional regulator
VVSARSARDASEPPKDLQVDFIDIDGQELAVITLPARVQGVSLAGLSEAEREVVHAVVAGKSNVDIARSRGTSARTVANQLASIYAKLGISSRHELVALSRTNG